MLTGEGNAGAIMSDSDYRPYLPAPGQSNIAGPTPRAHAQARMQNPRAQDLFGTWAKLGAAPFRGSPPAARCSRACSRCGARMRPRRRWWLRPAPCFVFCRRRSAPSPATRSTRSCGGTGRTPNFMSSTTGFGSTRPAPPSAKRCSRCCVRA